MKRSSSHHRKEEDFWGRTSLHTIPPLLSIFQEIVHIQNYKEAIPSFHNPCTWEIGKRNTHFWRLLNSRCLGARSQMWLFYCTICIEAPYTFIWPSRPSHGHCNTLLHSFASGPIIDDG